jgi:pyruvate formate lyase activating enzyme
MTMRRRTFLKCIGCGTAAAALGGTGRLPDVLNIFERAYAANLSSGLASHEAIYYRLLSNGQIECGNCPRHCRVSDNARGHCGIRENRNGKYVLLTYGLPCALNIDPIEKKPFFHFHPGTVALSLATAGCNVNCKFCQNWEISQARPEDAPNMNLSPREIVGRAINKQIPTIAYTYSEPTVWYEYMRDIAELARENKIDSVVISNGFIEKQPLADLLPYLSAYKIDLKSIREDYYRDVVRGELKPVLERLAQVRDSGTLLEIVNLVVPTLNDSEDDFRQLARWVKSNLGSDIPLHYSQFYPKYQLKNLPPTPQATLEMAHDVSKAEGLEYVYLGNLPGHPAESTYCPKCGELLIKRVGFRILQNNLNGNKCPKCNHVVPGVF